MRFNKFKLFILAMIICASCADGNKPTESESAQPVQEEQEVKREKVILFFGNSLTAGYGVKGDESFPSLIQDRIDSLGYDYEVVNAGVSGETTATGLSRIDWVLERHDVDIFVLELGANDGLRGLPPDQTKKNLIEIIDRVRRKEPGVEIILAGMMVPPSMGEDYANSYNPIYGEIAKEKEVELIPFLLEGVGGIDSLNQGDGIHPNPAGNRIVRENVWTSLAPLLKN